MPEQNTNQEYNDCIACEIKKNITNNTNQEPPLIVDPAEENQCDSCQ